MSTQTRRPAPSFCVVRHIAPNKIDAWFCRQSVRIEGSLWAQLQRNGRKILHYGLFLAGAALREHGHFT